MKKVKIIGHVDLDENDNAVSSVVMFNEKVEDKSEPISSTCCMCGSIKYVSECPCDIA